MTPYERVKTAWNSPNRHDELHHTVETMAAEGLTQEAIEEGLESLLLEVRAAGADDDTEEIINGVWDRLTGWCQEKWQIKTLPTAKELSRLPRWALVAFAARCARRVLPLFTLRWPDAPENYAARLNWAVEVGERSAAHAGAGEDWAPPAGALTCAYYVCDAVTNANRDRSRAIEVIKATSVAVAKFKDRAENILDSHTSDIFQAILSHTVGAIANHLATSPETYNAAIPVIYRIIRHDFDHLALLANKQQWTNETPVPPDVFGLMWPDGAPNNWPDEASEGNQLTSPDTTVQSLVGRLEHTAVA